MRGGGAATVTGAVGRVRGVGSSPGLMIGARPPGPPSPRCPLDAEPAAFLLGCRQQPAQGPRTASAQIPHAVCHRRPLSVLISHHFFLVLWLLVYCAFEKAVALKTKPIFKILPKWNRNAFFL